MLMTLESQLYFFHTVYSTCSHWQNGLSFSKVLIKHIIPGLILKPGTNESIFARLQSINIECHLPSNVNIEMKMETQT